AVALRLIPEAGETGAGATGQPLEASGIFAKVAGQRRHDAQRVIPEGVYLDRLADAWGHHPAADFRIHPGELQPFFARVEQAVGRVYVDVVTRATLVPIDDLAENGK